MGVGLVPQTSTAFGGQTATCPCLLLNTLRSPKEEGAEGTLGMSKR